VTDIMAAAVEDMAEEVVETPMVVGVVKEVSVVEKEAK